MIKPNGVIIVVEPVRILYSIFIPIYIINFIYSTIIDRKNFFINPIHAIDTNIFLRRHIRLDRLFSGLLIANKAKLLNSPTLSQKVNQIPNVLTGPPATI